MQMEPQPTTEEMMKRQDQPVNDCKDPFDKIRRDSEAATTDFIEDKKQKAVVAAVKALAVAKGMIPISESDMIPFVEKQLAEEVHTILPSEHPRPDHAEIATNILKLETHIQRLSGDPSFAFNARERSRMHNVDYHARIEAKKPCMISCLATCKGEGCLQNSVLLINLMGI